MLDDFLHNLSRPGATAWEVKRHEIIPARKAVTRKAPRSLDPRVRDIINSRVRNLYSHQVEAINHSLAGKDVVLATSTASGKSLAFQSILAHILLQDPKATAIMLFPLKALERDQRDAFISFVGDALGLEAEVYDGDTPESQRKKIRNNPPRALITNPDMLHLSILGHWRSWSEFLANLKFVVLDEAHTYKGIFGAHISQTLLRLERLCANLGSNPQFFSCSATISNPSKFITNLTGRKPEVVEKTGAGSAQRHFVFMDPVLSPYTVATRLFIMGLQQGLKTIVFTKARKITELITSWALDEEPPLKNRISSYRAGFLPEERREIEAKLFSGQMDGVISTSALEMGIDVGGLDLCILVGYPGAIISTWQRGGRVGRGMKPSAIVMIAGHDALDQYFLNNPDDFFNRPCEEAILDPYNEEVLKKHLPCAAAEARISVEESWTKNEATRRALDDLVRDRLLNYFEDQKTWNPVSMRPHREVDLRGIGRSYGIFLEGTNKLLGGVSGIRALKECHEGAVYLHRTRKYIVTKLDLKRGNAQVKPARLNYYTRAVSEKDTEILGKPVRREQYPGYVVQEANLKVTERIVAYEKRRTNGQDLIDTVDLDLPPVIFKTVGFWIEIPEKIKNRIEKDNLQFMGGIHAMEHAMISLLPIHALCDRDDIGGISFTMHDQVCGPAVFIYDGHPGGVGLSRRAFDKIAALVEQTLKLVNGCPCDTGCPSCIHSPKCGSGNKPLDKEACVKIMRMLIDPSLIKPKVIRRRAANNAIFPDQAPESIDGQERIQGPDQLEQREKSRKSPKPPPKHPINSIQSSRDKGPAIPKPPVDHYVVFDLETRKLAHEVGGWANVPLMGLSVGVAYSNREGFITFYEEDVNDLVALLKSSDLVVGFNHVGFDYKVLSAYTDYDFHELNNLDMLVEVKKVLGFRLKLQSLAEATLKEGKTADGLVAAQWFREGKLDLVEKYCRDDVRITRDLYLFAAQNGRVLYRNKKGTVITIPVDWPRPLDLAPGEAVSSHP